MGTALLAAAVLAVPGGPGGSGDLARAEAPGVYSVEGARILAAPGRTVERGTVVIRGGLIEAAGPGAKSPADAVIIDGEGLTVHAGFIDACSRVAAPREKEDADHGEAAEERGAAHPVARIRPERRMLEILSISDEEMSAHRRMGFTAALVVPEAGVFRGTSVLVATGDGPARDLIIRQDVAQHIAFEHGRFREPYPSSLMGSIAAIRQAFADARRAQTWQARYEADPTGMRRPAATSAWEPLWRAALGEIPVIFDVDSPQNLLRAISLAEKELLRSMYVGSGFDYEIAARLADAGAAVIVPLAFPEKPALEEEGEALEVETRELERFLGARANPARLASAGVTFAFGTCRMEKPAGFTSHLLEVLEAGLEPEEALAALTTAPARMLGVDRALGTVEPGKAAHLVLREGPFHAEGSTVRSVWVDGVRYLVKPPAGGGPGRPGEAPSGRSLRARAGAR